MLHANHKFIWDSEPSDMPSAWEKRLAKKYYDKLFKEYCVADLSRYKENKVGRPECAVIETQPWIAGGLTMAYRKGGDRGQGPIRVRQQDVHQQRSANQLGTEFRVCRRFEEEECTRQSPPVPRLLAEVELSFTVRVPQFVTLHYT